MTITIVTGCQHTDEATILVMHGLSLVISEIVFSFPDCSKSFHIRRTLRYTCASGPNIASKVYLDPLNTSQLCQLH